MRLLPPMRLRLIATDLDGTLLRRDGSVSSRTRATLARAVAAGVELVIVTARPPRYLDLIAAQLELRGVAICANGAIHYDLAARRVIVTRALDGDTARGVVAALRPVAPGIGFAVETGHRVVFEPAFAKPDNGDLRFAASSVAQMWRLGLPVVKLLAWSGTATADELLLVARAAVRGAAEVTHSGGASLLEVSAAGVSKVSALAGLCASLGVRADEVVAFGDMPNDLDMLAWAGLGYAVANAHPDVLAGAAARTGSNDEDGVATALEALL